MILQPVFIQYGKDPMQYVTNYKTISEFDKICSYITSMCIYPVSQKCNVN